MKLQILANVKWYVTEYDTRYTHGSYTSLISFKKGEVIDAEIVKCHGEHGVDQCDVKFNNKSRYIDIIPRSLVRMVL